MTLEDSILKWLRESGFPLEMEAAAAFRNAGFEVRQGSVVLDGQEQKSREIDVLAVDPDIYGLVNIKCVVECKSSKAHPWVIFTADDVLSGYGIMHAFCLSSPHAKEEMYKELSRSNELKRLMPSGSGCGYAFKQALGSNDHAYSASVSVLKACSVIAANVIDKPNLPQLNFVFPIIVVDSPLFECSLGDNGELTLTQVEESSFLYSAYVPEYAGCCIKVVTKQALASAALQYKEMANILRELFEERAIQRFHGEQ